MISFSYTDDSTVYADPPTNATCIRCREAFWDETDGETRSYCESCEDFIEGQQDKGIKLSGVVMGLIAKAKEQVK